MRYVHSGSLGDVLASLPFVKRLGGGTYYLKPNVPAQYAQGQVHPCGNVRMTEAFANLLIPLLNSQAYIDQAELYNGQEVDIDLDDFRMMGIDYGCGCLSGYYRQCFQVDLDLSQPSIDVEPSPRFNNAVLVNRTQRYHNPYFRYDFLAKYPRVVFVGLEDEYKSFVDDYNLKIDGVEARDYLELAEWVAGCKVFVGNQSSPYQLAELIKVPRVLEICPWCPNVQPHGLQAWDCWSPSAVEKVLDRLHGM